MRSSLIIITQMLCLSQFILLSIYLSGTGDISELLICKYSDSIILGCQENNSGTGTSLPAKEEVTAVLNELSGRYDIFLFPQLLSQSAQTTSHGHLFQMLSAGMWPELKKCHHANNKKRPKKTAQLKAPREAAVRQTGGDFISFVRSVEKAACCISSPQQSVI